MTRAAEDEPSPEFEHSVLVNAAPTRVLAAFFDPHALAVVVAGRAVGHDAAAHGGLRGRVAAHHVTQTTCSGGWAASFTAR